MGLETRVEKILIIGAAGLIGSALCEILSRRGYTIWGIDKELLRSNLIFADITKRETLENLFLKIDPDVIMLTAALSYVDYCEQYPEESKIVNIQGLKNVLNYINTDKKKIVFFSSDYIFDGLYGPYSEDDEPNPICVYGKHKLMGETLVKERTENHLIIRTTWVYGPEIKGKNFALSLIRKLRNNEKVKVPVDQIGCPTYAINLTEVIEELVRKNKCGTYNIVGADILDRFNYSLNICNEFGLNKSLIIPVKTEYLNQKARRPLKAGLKIDKVKSEIETKILGVKEGLLSFKKDIQNALFLL